MSKFGDAFAAARKAGKKEFTWKGKQYNTEMKETVRPKARGMQAKAKSTGPMPRPKNISPKPRPKAAPEKKASKGFFPDFKGIREGNQASREARRKARDRRRGN